MHASVDPLNRTVRLPNASPLRGQVDTMGATGGDFGAGHQTMTHFAARGTGLNQQQMTMRGAFPRNQQYHTVDQRELAARQPSKTGFAERSYSTDGGLALAMQLQQALPAHVQHMQRMAGGLEHAARSQFTPSGDHSSQSHPNAAPCGARHVTLKNQQQMQDLERFQRLQSNRSPVPLLRGPSMNHLQNAFLYNSVGASPQQMQPQPGLLGSQPMQASLVVGHGSKQPQERSQRAALYQGSQ